MKDDNKKTKNIVIVILIIIVIVFASLGCFERTPQDYIDAEVELYKLKYQQKYPFLDFD